MNTVISCSKTINDKLQLRYNAQKQIAIISSPHHYRNRRKLSPMCAFKIFRNSKTTNYDYGYFNMIFSAQNG